MDDLALHNLKDEKSITALAVTGFEKDLGVNIDSDLTFKEHVNHVTAKANRILGVIRRTLTDHLHAHRTL